jgi:hypothetical protein
MIKRQTKEVFSKSLKCRQTRYFFLNIYLVSCTCVVYLCYFLTCYILTCCILVLYTYIIYLCCILTCYILTCYTFHHLITPQRRKKTLLSDVPPRTALPHDILGTVRVPAHRGPWSAAPARPGPAQLEWPGGLWEHHRFYLCIMVMLYIRVVRGRGTGGVKKSPSVTSASLRPFLAASAGRLRIYLRLCFASAALLPSLTLFCSPLSTPLTSLPLFGGKLRPYLSVANVLSAFASVCLCLPLSASAFVCLCLPLFAALYRLHSVCFYVPLPPWMAPLFPLAAASGALSHMPAFFISEQPFRSSGFSKQREPTGSLNRVL